MKRVDIDTSDEGQLTELLESDSLDRNKNINTLLKFVNSIDGNYCLNLDGGWELEKQFV